MEHISEIIDDILTEWAYQVNDGMPDVDNPLHMAQLEHSLNDLEFPSQFIVEFMSNLREGEFQARSVKSGKVVDYKSKESMEKAIEDGRAEPLEKGSEKEPEKEKEPEDKEKPIKKSKPEISKDDEHTGDVSHDLKVDKLKKDAEKDTEEKNISKENQKIVGDFDKRINDNIEFLSDEKKQVAKETLEKIKALYDENSTPEQQKEVAQWMVDNAGLSSNQMPKSGQRKAYLNKIGGDRKILGNGTQSTENLVQKVESLLGEIKSFDSKAVTQGFTTAAKPDLGDENIVKPKEGSDDPVTKYFSDHPILQKIRGGLHGIYAVKGEDGKPKMPSSKHSKEYLTQSFKNPALQKTIDFANKQAAAGGVDKGVATSLEKHQKNLDNILKNYEIPSEEARQAVADSYNELMVGLHKSDPDVASSIMKQIAENNLYEQELAAGEEVYLPSAGNFPAGDKIKGGTTETVALVSCKFGKSGRIYGCPANSKTICELHPDPKKQNNQGQYLGEEGYTLVINDELIKGKTKEETKEKTKGFIKNTLSEIGLGDTFSDDEVNEIATITADYMEDIDNIKKELAGKEFPNKGAYWKEFSKRVAKMEDGYKKRMGKVVTKEHAAALIGENNAGNLVQKGGVKIEALMSAIEIANNIRTNESLNELEHNKQYYDENGKPKFVTDKGNQNPDDYSITFRTKRTAGRTGGGCQLSFTGDGKTPNTSLNKDGSATDSQTGIEREV